MRGVEVDGLLIRRLRIASGLTQSDLATRVDCDEKTVRKAESNKGRIDVRLAVTIAEHLNCEPVLIIKCAEESSVQVLRNKEIVLAWNDAYVESDVERIMSLHHENSILEIPGSEGLPAGGNYSGIGQIRSHMIEMFSLFKLVHVSEVGFDLHAFDDVAFLRSTATFRFLPNDKEFTARFLNEFQFKDGRIFRRVSISDLTGFRESSTDLIVKQLPRSTE